MKPTAPVGFLTIDETAAKLGVSPWEVLNLTQRDELTAVTFVDSDSLSEYERRSA